MFNDAGKVTIWTESGSIYELEENSDGSGVWCRLEASPKSNHLKYSANAYVGHSPIAVGYNLNFYGNPTVDHPTGELVTTSRVIKIKKDGMEDISEKHS